MEAKDHPVVLFSAISGGSSFQPIGDRPDGRPPMAIKDATATSYMEAAVVIVIPFLRGSARRNGSPLVVVLTFRADVLARPLVAARQPSL